MDNKRTCIYSTCVPMNFLMYYRIYMHKRQKVVITNNTLWTHDKRPLSVTSHNSSGYGWYKDGMFTLNNPILMTLYKALTCTWLLTMIIKHNTHNSSITAVYSDWYMNQPQLLRDTTDLRKQTVVTGQQRVKVYK